MANIRFTPIRTGSSNAAGERISSIDPLLSRTHYFDGQLLKAADLQRDQIYLDERLLELGQVIGSGIVKGLKVSLDDRQRLTVEPGIAIAPSGRALQLSNGSLGIDLLNAGLIATLNNGQLRRYARGLYALTLCHADVIDGVAEAYPKDLAAPRIPQVAAWAEGVELRLMPLALPLPQQDEISVRATLARELLSGGERLALPSDDAVALGLIAVDRGRILWLDRGLLRRPQRPLNTPNAPQQDLAVHYQELLETVLSTRRGSGLSGAFAASQYFRVLPPWGPIPSPCIDPVGGRQLYFPKDYEVSIAPVRRSELATVQAEAAALAPIDLERDADCDILVLVPMSDSDFALRARQLEAPAEFRPSLLGSLARLDRLALRVRPQAPIHRVDTDADVWRAIWGDSGPADLLYVRRPPRTAETGVSAVVLAQGFALPPLGSAESGPLPPDLPHLDRLVEELKEQEDARQETLASHAAEVERLKLRIVSLENALAAAGGGSPMVPVAELEALQAELTQARQQIEMLEAGARQAAVLTNMVEAASARIDALKAELEAARAEIERLNTAPAPVDSGLAQRLVQLETALQAEQDKAATATAANGQLSAQIEALKQQVGQLETDLKRAQDQLATAGGAGNGTSTDNALQALRDEAEKLKAELASTQGSLDSTRTELAAANTTIGQLRAEAAAGVVLGKELTLAALAGARGADDAGIKAATSTDRLIGANDRPRVAAVQIVGLADRQYEPALWPSLLAVAQQNVSLLEKLRDELFMAAGEQDLAVLMSKLGQGLRLPAAVIELWKPFLL